MRTKALIVAAVLACVVSPAWAGEKEGVAGRVDAVTVYRSQAAVTRLVPVPVGAGPMEIVVTALPEGVVPDSLHADGGDGVQIRAVRYRERQVRDDPTKGVRELATRIAALDKSLRENQEAQEAARRRQEFLRTLGTLSAQTVAADKGDAAAPADKLRNLTQVVAGQIEALDAKLAALEAAEDKLIDQVNERVRKRATLSPAETRTVREAVVFIDKRQAEPAELRLGYLVKDVGWTPSYNVRIREGRDTVELEYNASIQQRSGEDWTGAALVLSTATPTLSSDPPALAPFRVILDTAPESKAAHDIIRAERERIVAEEEFRGAQTDDLRRQAEAAANTAAARKNVLYFHGSPKVEDVVPDAPGGTATPAMAVNYPLEGRHSLASRDDRQTIQVASLKLPAAFYRLAQPTLTRYVYRQAQLTNASNLVLLQGKVHAYLDGKFAGAGTLPLVRPGQRFTAGFGVDTRLSGRQTLLARQENVMGGNKELLLTYVILLQNFSNEPLTVRVLDRFPTAAEDKILVTLLEVKPETSKDPVYAKFLKPRNILRWDVEVPAGAMEDKAMVLQYQFKVMFAKSLRIHAGRTITPLFALVKPLEPWKVEYEWSKDQTTLALAAGKPGEAELLHLTLTRGRAGKNVIGRRVDGDLSAYRWFVVDLENKISEGTRVALALSTGTDWDYFESMPSYAAMGENPNLVFDLTAPNYKAEQKKWAYTERVKGLDAVRAVYLVFYPSSSGKITVRGIKLAK